MAQRLAQVKSDLGVSAPSRIRQYREKYPIDRNALRNIVYDGEKYRIIVDRCIQVMVKNPQIFKHMDMEDLNRPEERKEAAKMLLAYHKMRPIRPEEAASDPHAVALTSHPTYTLDPGTSVRADLTLHLYLKSIQMFCNPNNPAHQEWIRKAQKAEDIGCFGLTQIGHGSNTKDMETIATYNHDSRTFTLNSSPFGYKFWIGGAAQIANMAIIWAQLVIKGQKYGAHPFVVSLRDTKSLKVHQGVIIGDCGPKVGLHQIDNGYIGFDNYSIPLDSLLDRISGVDSNGNFRAIEEDLSKRHGMYMGPLSLGRAFITINSPTAALNALLIAVKYSCVRRQFQNPFKGEQTLLIDYPLTRWRLMPALATAYIQVMVGSHILKLYGDNAKAVLEPRNKMAAMMHAVSAVGKAVTSWHALEVIGSCRHFLAGHGYSAYSRLGRLYFDNDISTTWEGDNHMLLQQAIKYALKVAQNLQNKPDDRHFMNFVSQEIILPQEWNRDTLWSIDNLEKIMRTRFMEANQATTSAMLAAKSKGMANDEVWNHVQPFYAKKFGLLFGALYYLHVFRQKISTMEGSLKELSENCIRLWIYTLLEKDRWESSEIRLIFQDLIKELSDWLAPRSISLLESLTAGPELIGSPFADWDGDRMWDKYLGQIFTSKDTFARPTYYQDIISRPSAQ